MRDEVAVMSNLWLTLAISAVLIAGVFWWTVVRRVRRQRRKKRP